MTCEACGAVRTTPDNPRGWPQSVLDDLDEAWPPVEAEQIAALAAVRS